MRLAIISFCLLLPLSLLAQGKKDSNEVRGEVSFYSNTPSFPLSGQVFTTPYHPGIDLGASTPFNVKKKGRWELSGNLNYYYHRLSHHGIGLRGGIRYRRMGDPDSGRYGFSWELGLKMGYLHMITERARYELNEETGEYEKLPSTGRSQFSFGLATGPAYRFPQAPKWELFLNYRFWVQTPFVNQYVPVLPNVALHFGLRFQLPSKYRSE